MPELARDLKINVADTLGGRTLARLALRRLVCRMWPPKTPRPESALTPRLLAAPLGPLVRDGTLVHSHVRANVAPCAAASYRAAA